MKFLYVVYFIDALRRGLYLVEVERHVPWHRAVEPGLCEACPLVLELVRPAGVALAHSSHPGIDGLETMKSRINWLADVYEEDFPIENDHESKGY